MTKEEKQLLLQDLCARLPYGIKIAAIVSNCEFNTIGGYCDLLDDFYIREVDGWFNVSMIKPYLRPISSMTEEEWNEYENFITNEKDDQIRFCNELTFYNSHYFDYRGLIEKGLAIEAPNDMYK